MTESSGIFTQHGPDGIFGRGGPPTDATAPVVGSDGNPLRETLVAVFPSPGHMRVARAVRDLRTGQVERREEFRDPSPQEAGLLAQQGVHPDAPMAVAPTLGSIPSPAELASPGFGRGAGGALGAAANGKPGVPTWVKVVGGVAVLGATAWAVNKWVLPKLLDKDEEEADDGDED